MKPSRVAKYEQQLTDAEEELRLQLSVVLPRVSSSGESLFTNSGNIPKDVLPHWLPPESEPLFALATECIERRQFLALPSEGSLAAAFLEACAEASQVSNPHRRGPRQLAVSLLPRVNANAT
jgi:hypothetical protein